MERRRIRLPDADRTRATSDFAASAVSARALRGGEKAPLAHVRGLPVMRHGSRHQHVSGEAEKLGRVRVSWCAGGCCWPQGCGRFERRHELGFRSRMHQTR